MKNKITNAILAFTLSILLINCSHEEGNIEPSKESKTDKDTRLVLSEDEMRSLALINKSHEIPFKEIQRQAEEIMLDFTQTTSTSRSSHALTPTYTKIVTSRSNAASRAMEDSATLAYLVNFSNTQNLPSGYAVVSADDRIPGVIAMSPQGNIKDTVTTPGLNMVLSHMEDYMMAKIEEYNIRYDSILHSTLARIYATLPDSLLADQDSLSGNRIDPYNELCRTCYGKVWYSYGSWTNTSPSFT